MKFSHGTKIKFNFFFCWFIVKLSINNFLVGQELGLDVFCRLIVRNSSNSLNNFNLPIRDLAGQITRVNIKQK